MDWEFGQALDGNIALMGEIDRRRTNREFTVAIALGDGHHAALSAAMMQTLSTPYRAHLQALHRAVAPRGNPPKLAGRRPHDGGRLMQHQPQHHPGARRQDLLRRLHRLRFDPLGQHRRATTIWAATTWSGRATWSSPRTALLACGRVDTARRALVYLACTQRPDGSFAQNFWIDGTPYWTGIQLDEVAFPIMLAWRLWKVDGLGDFDVFPFVERAAGFLVRYAPVTQQERWEENAGLLALDAGRGDLRPDLRRRHRRARHGSTELGALPGRATPTGSKPTWTSGPSTTEGVLLPGRASATTCASVRRAAGEPFHNDRCREGMIHIANRGPGEKYDFEAREIIDARLPGAGALRHSPRRRSADRRLAEGGRSRAEDRYRRTGPAGGATTTTATASGKMAARSSAGVRAAPGRS